MWRAEGFFLGDGEGGIFWCFFRVIFWFLEEEDNL